MTRILIPRSACVPVLLCLVFAGCGGERSSPSTSASPTSTSTGSTHVSTEDGKVFAKIFAQTQAWRSALKPWLKAYQAGDPDSFLAVEGGYTATMQRALERIELLVQGVHERSLRSLLLELAKAYRAEFKAVVDLNNSVINRDTKAGQRGLTALQDTNQRKVTIAKRLASAYPALNQWARKAH